MVAVLWTTMTVIEGVVRVVNSTAQVSTNSAVVFVQKPPGIDVLFPLLPFFLSSRLRLWRESSTEIFSLLRYLSLHHPLLVSVISFGVLNELRQFGCVPRRMDSISNYPKLSRQYNLPVVRECKRLYWTVQILTVTISLSRPSSGHSFLMILQLSTDPASTDGNNCQSFWSSSRKLLCDWHKHCTGHSSHYPPVQYACIFNCNGVCLCYWSTFIWPLLWPESKWRWVRLLICWTFADYQVSVVYSTNCPACGEVCVAIGDCFISQFVFRESSQDTATLVPSISISVSPTRMIVSLPSQTDIVVQQTFTPYWPFTWASMKLSHLLLQERQWLQVPL